MFRATHSVRANSARAGFSLIELTIAMAIMTVILLATAASLQKEAENVTDLQRLTYSERLIQDLFTKIEQRLDFAQGIDPTTTLAATLGGATTSSMTLTGVVGIPHTGIVVVEPGSAFEERVRYGALDAPNSALETLTRGERDTNPAAHPAGAMVLWEGCAMPIENQIAPAAGTFDGQTDDLRGPLFYRGDGVGFAYHRPVDPTGNGNFMGPTGIQWGAQVGGRETEDGTAALVFTPVATISEADRNFDINRDGDLDDVFDIGRISDLAWNNLNIALGSSQVELISPIILQERNNYGSDLDNDGFEDPIFLWTPNSGRLRIRLFALMGDVRGRDVVKRFETVLYLRNGAAE